MAVKEPDVADDPSTQALARRVKGEYLEMPGLSLTPDQARRLWNVEASECQRILDELVGLEFLRKTQRGCYVRRDAAA